MKDRVSKYPGRALITPEDGSAPFYATITRADEPTQAGDSMSKNTFLKDSTAALFGLGNTAVPDDVFKKQHQQNQDFVATLAQLSSSEELVLEFITTSKVWTAPKARSQQFMVIAVGGGGGGLAQSKQGYMSPGGGSGHIAVGTFVIPEDTAVTAICGAGGTGGYANTSNYFPGKTGGTTSFGNYISAQGGSGGGSNGDFGSGGYGGAGGGGNSTGGNGSFGGGGGSSNAGGNGGTYGGGGGGLSTGGTGGTYGGNGGTRSSPIAADGAEAEKRRTILFLIAACAGISIPKADSTGGGQEDDTLGGGGGGYGGPGGYGYGGGGGFFGSGGNNHGGGGGFFGNGGEGGYDSGVVGCGGGGGFLCDGGDGAAASGASYRCAGGGGGGFLSAGGDAVADNAGDGGNGGVLVIYFNPEEEIL